jgi:hypothetical protein
MRNDNKGDEGDGSVGWPPVQGVDRGRVRGAIVGHERLGNVIDVTATAREAGFEMSVAVTVEAWQDAVAWDDDAGHQSETDRLWQVLVMARRCYSPSRTRSAFPVVRVPHTQGDRLARLPRVITLHLVTGRSQTGRLVATITRPGQEPGRNPTPN